MNYLCDKKTKTKCDSFYKDAFMNRQKYIELLESNWKELKKWLKEQLPTTKEITTKSVKLIEIYNKMQELESGKHE